MKSVILTALSIVVLLLGGCITDTIPRQYRYSERKFPAMPNASAPYEVWLTTEGTSRWVMFADRIRTTCKHAIVEFRAPESTQRKAIYDLKNTGLFPDDDFPYLVGCTETYSYWLSSGNRIVSVSHYEGVVRVFDSPPTIVWHERKIEIRNRDSIEIRTKDGDVYLLSPERIEKRPNKAMEPSRVAVTDCAGAHSAPATRLAHLWR